MRYISIHRRVKYIYNLLQLDYILINILKFIKSSDLPFKTTKSRCESRCLHVGACLHFFCCASQKDWREMGVSMKPIFYFLIKILHFLLRRSTTPRRKREFMMYCCLANKNGSITSTSHNPDGQKIGFV